jgi:hypothetical protein
MPAARHWQDGRDLLMEEGPANTKATKSCRILASAQGTGSGEGIIQKSSTPASGFGCRLRTSTRADRPTLRCADRHFTRLTQNRLWRGSAEVGGADRLPYELTTDTRARPSLVGQNRTFGVWT